jgi:hypothetical protein
MFSIFHCINGRQRVYSLEPTCRTKNTSNSYYRFLYVRFIGDRSTDEKDFGKIQKDRVIEMKKWSSKIKRVINKEGRRR